MCVKVNLICDFVIFPHSGLRLETTVLQPASPCLVVKDFNSASAICLRICVGLDGVLVSKITSNVILDAIQI